MLLREGHFLIVQRTVIETEHQPAFDQVCLFDNLGHLTLADDFPLKGAQEKKAVGHAFLKPHRNRSGIDRQGWTRT